MRTFLTFGILCTVALVTGRALSQEVKPNIIFVMADDMGWGQTGYRGHPVLKTPNLDAMEENGLRFDRFYAGNPVCSPTRACVMTGRTNERTGVLTHGYGLRLQEKTIAQALKTKGYVTGHFGKWHLNGFKGPGAPVLAADPRSPGAFGFDEWLSATNFIDMDPYLGRNGVPEKMTGDSSELIVDEAVKFLDKHRASGKPMFTVIWYGTPHSPFKASDADRSAFADLDEESANHHGELVAMDRSIGTLRQKLREFGLEKNTLLVFCSDNGGLPNIQPNTTGGLRGNKGQVYEGGLRVPGIMEWPGVVKARVTQHPACVVDLFPTVADIVGLPDSSFIQPVDGVSLKPLFDGETGSREKPIFFRYGAKTAFVDNQYKLVANDLKAGPFELYDLESDAQETKDLSAEKPELMAKMKAAWQVWNESVDASFAGQDYPEGKVTPPDPESIFWFESEMYKPYVKEWTSYWAYTSFIESGGKEGKKGKKGKKSQE